MDLKESWANLGGWCTTPNLYLFPDIALMSFAMLFSNNPWIAHIVYAFIELLFLPLLIYWNLQIICRDKSTNWSSSVIASVFLLCTFRLVSLGFENSQTLLSTLLKPGGHGGAAFAGLAFTAALGMTVQSRGRLWVVSLIAILSVASDTIFVVQFLIPSACLIAISLLLTKADVGKFQDSCRVGVSRLIGC